MSKFLLHGRLTITKSAVRYKMIGNSIFALNFFPFLPSLQINILEMIFFSFYTIAKLWGKCWGSLSRFLSNSLYLFLSLTIYYVFFSILLLLPSAMQSSSPEHRDIHETLICFGGILTDRTICLSLKLTGGITFISHISRN